MKDFDFALEPFFDYGYMYASLQVPEDLDLTDKEKLRDYLYFHWDEITFERPDPHHSDIHMLDNKGNPEPESFTLED